MRLRRVPETPACSRLSATVWEPAVQVVSSLMTP